MIRYPILEADLVAQIKIEKKSWLKRASTRTAVYVAAGGYTGRSEFWGEIKGVYITLQHEKCAYCETKLQGSELASKVHEVEHYRPKSSVKEWTHSRGWATGSNSTIGYYPLAYHYFNYAIGCTRCNSTLKSNFFPILGPRDVRNINPANMQLEQPLLLYPISSIDKDDPQDIITFDGVLPIPKRKKGRAYKRAVVNIEFFKLDHEDLTSRRAPGLVSLWVALQSVANPTTGPKDREAAEKIISYRCSPQSEFSACFCAFRQLYHTNFARAQQLAHLLVDTLPG
ncbi:HNH endonuclease family protein [Pseudomonas grimontii]|uniref:hypothetical protein n=1 Tax=Pseudomonas grimontii TaxID=129847 RepID=UPI00387ABCA1